MMEPDSKTSVEDQNGELDVLLKPEQAAKILNISKPYVYQMASRGQLRSVKWECAGNGDKKRETVRFRKSDILKFIEDHLSKGNTE